MRFQLGERVRWTHDTSKDSQPYYVTWATGELDGPETGIVVGFRSLMDYRLENESDFDELRGVTYRWTESTPVKGTARRAWLVVKNIRAKPVLVLDEYIEGVEDE